MLTTPTTCQTASRQCSRKRGQPLKKKRKKSCFLDFEKNVKNVRSFTFHLITQPLITHYRKSVPVSHGHQHQISCSEVWTQESMQLRIACVINAYKYTHNIGSFEAQISIDIQQTFSFFCNNVSIIEDKIFATDFLRFFQSHFKKT